MAGGVLVEDLRGLVASRSLLVVAGAGVSAGASGGARVASWPGLLLDGCGRVEEVDQGGLPARWGELVRWQVESGDLGLMLAAGEEVTSRLGGRSGGEFGRWLADSVGGLRARDRSAIGALAVLGVPVATTNYDGLIEEVTGWPAVTWRDGARVLRVLRGDERGVLHLHGYWGDPESVVLGIRSYEAVLGDAAAQGLQRAVASLRSLLLVGFGAGLADPNFRALREWLAVALPGSGYRHFRLCRDEELAAVAAQHRPQERVMAVSYGTGYADLAPFVRALAGGGPNPAEPDAARGAKVAVRGLPAAPVCVGRDDLVAEVTAALLGDPVVPVAVLGAPGIGKSTVCLAALHGGAVAQRFGARRWFVRCDGAADAATLLAAIAAELGLAGEALAGGPLAWVRAELGSGPGVLVLDNLETPWGADTIAVERLLADLAATRAVVMGAIRGTARPAGLRWHSTAPLPPLALADAREMFLGIAGAQFADDARLDDLLEAVDRVPLAVELLACNAQGEPDLTALASRWEIERSRLLARAGGAARELSVAVSAELSVSSPQMTSEGLQLLKLLGHLPDGIAGPDLDALLPGHGLRAAANLRQLGLAFSEAGRLRMLAPIREHAATAHPPADADLLTAISHYCTLAAAQGNRVGYADGARAAQRIAGEAGNLARMITLAIDRRSWQAAADATTGLSKYMRLTGMDIPGLLDRVLADIRQHGSDLQQARILSAMADIALHRSDYDAAQAGHERALQLFRQVGSVLGEADCIESLADIALERSDHDAARAGFERALPLFRQVRDVLGEANCIKGLASIALARSDHDAARAGFEQALPLFRQAGSVLGEANCIQGLADIALERSDHDAARAGFEQALPLFRQVGSVIGEANSIQSLADMALERSDRDGARAGFEQALQLYQQVGEPYSMGGAHRRMARLTTGAEHDAHVDAVRKAWLSINRPDLVADLAREFGSGDYSP
jgi:tetratricopeptide (TPR) repeat protein